MRSLTTLITAGTALLIAACGSTATGVSTSPGSGQTGGPQGAGRRGTAGELAKIDNNTLILNTQAGDITVQITPTTPVQKTSTGTVADIASGSCIVAVSQKDASGALTAQTVRVSSKQNGTCTFGRPGGGGPSGPGNGRPADGSKASPGAQAPGRNSNVVFAAGEVTAVNGTAVSVQPAAGGAAQTITVPTTVRVSRAAPAAISDLAVGQCVQAGGSKDSSGTVKATNLNIVPPGPAGCFTGGGLGGRRGGNGAGGGGAGGGGQPRGD